MTKSKATPTGMSTKKRSVPTRRLMSMGAFFQNDLPTGVGFVIRDGAEMWAQFVDTGLQSYRQHAGKYDYIHYFSQFAGFAKNRDNLSFADTLIAITNIAYLEEIGAIRADDYNGMQYMYDILPKDIAA